METQVAFNSTLHLLLEFSIVPPVWGQHIQHRTFLTKVIFNLVSGTWHSYSPWNQLLIPIIFLHPNSFLPRVWKLHHLMMIPRTEDQSLKSCYKRSVQCHNTSNGLIIEFYESKEIPSHSYILRQVSTQPLLLSSSCKSFNTATPLRED